MSMQHRLTLHVLTQLTHCELLLGMAPVSIARHALNSRDAGGALGGGALLSKIPDSCHRRPRRKCGGCAAAGGEMPPPSVKRPYGGT